MTGPRKMDKATNADSARPLAQFRWPHVIALILLFSAGAVFRFHQLRKQSLWLDEYWCVYNATRFGQPSTSVFHAPVGAVLDPPPPTGFAGAPPWWHIWNGLDNTFHPPLFYILLRFWIKLCGDSDIAVRSLSAIFGLGAALLLLKLIHRNYGPWRGLAAAGLMLFSWEQIDQSRQVRPYTLVIFIGLICIDLVMWINRRGASPLKIFLLFLFAAAMELTHYFSAGFLAGLGIYVLIHFRGRERVVILGALASAAVLVVAAWGPFFFGGNQVWQYQIGYPSPGTNSHIAEQLLQLPARMVLSPWHFTWTATIPLMVLVSILPIFQRRRNPDALLWWMWMIVGELLVAALDVYHQTLLVFALKYTLPASVGMFALAAIQPPLQGREGRFRAPILIFLCFGALWSVIETMHLEKLLPPEQWGLLLVPAVLLVLAVGLKNSWRLWTAAGMVLAATSNLFLLAAIDSHPMLTLIFVPLIYILLAGTAPRGPINQKLPQAAAWALVGWAIVIDVQSAISNRWGAEIVDWRTTSREIDEKTGPRDVIAFVGGGKIDSALMYIAYKRYSQNSNRPVIILGDYPVDPMKLRNFPNVWAAGHDPDADTLRFFQGFRHGPATQLPACEIWQVFR